MGLLEKFNLKQTTNYHPKEYYAKRKNKKHYIIHHYCPHTYNAGDHFVILSIRKHLKNFLPNCTFIPKAVAGNRGWGKPIGLKGKNIFYSNKYADAVILGGSDQYNDWSPKIKADEIKHLLPPLFLIGLGVSSKDIDLDPFLKDRKYRRDILETNKKASSSSVRDKATQTFLENLGFHNSIVTGCPALFLFDKKFNIKNSNKNVLFTFPYPLIHGTKNPRKQQKFNILYRLIRDIIQYVESKNLNPIIVCHDDRDVPQAQKLFPGHTIFFSNYPNKYFDLYKNARMVIGSRLHATILASSLGIPSININLDLRGSGFSKTFKLDKWNLDYNDKHLTQKARKRISTILKCNPSPFKIFIKTKNEYRKVFLDFMEKVAQNIREF